MRWGFEALAINEFQGLTFTCQGIHDDKGCMKTGEAVLTYLSFDGHTTAYPVFGMGMLMLGFLAFTFVMLERNQMNYLSMGHTGSKYAAFVKSVDTNTAEHKVQSIVLNQTADIGALEVAANENATL